MPKETLFCQYMNQITMKPISQLLLCIAGTCIALQACAQTPAAPASFNARAYDSHVELRWQATPNAGFYRIYRSADGGATFPLLKQVVASNTNYLDWTGDEGANLERQYRVSAVSVLGSEGPQSPIQSVQIAPFSDSALLDMVQEYHFRYFWDYAHPVSGMARERSNGDGQVVTTGGTGFGVMAIIVGAERGWVSRQAAAERLLLLTSFLQFADRFHGVFPHWMNGQTGQTIPFSQYDNGADLVETAFLIQGLLTARQYFNQNNPVENSLRTIITGLWEEVEWDWFRKNNGPVLYWHWSPNYGWQMNFPLKGFYEAQIVYILAAASPTHPVPASLYQSGWTSGNYANNATHFGYKVFCGPYGGGPLFFAHYSYLGFDPRGIKDAFCNYFIRNRNHSLIQYEYCKINPENHPGYSAQCWGLTASDDPWGYQAHDIWPANDNGTISPTAALSSMPYTPQESMAALKHFYRNLGATLWGPYGFYDAFNLGANWVAPSFLAIDQGPIVGMIENYRSGLLWNRFMANPEIAPVLTAIGFVPDNTSATAMPGANTNMLVVTAEPNVLAPNEPLRLRIQAQEACTMRACLMDAQGRVVQQLFEHQRFDAGENRWQGALPDLPTGAYWIQIQCGNTPVQAIKIIRK
jgi:hypothetical protein